MISKLVKSESGFGLIQAVAALFIATIAIAGLFMASYIARHQAKSNYHYKVVLLKGLETLERIKHRAYILDTKQLTPEVISLVPPGYGEFIIDDQNENAIKGFIPRPTYQTNTEMLISPFVKYDQLTLRLTWRDGPKYFVNQELNYDKQIILREDYFYRSGLVIP
jgi:hypothetical protein